VSQFGKMLLMFSEDFSINISRSMDRTNASTFLTMQSIPRIN